MATILITGGTGTFGNAVVESQLANTKNEIRIFSRDEKKQEDMRLKFNTNRLKFYIGDVRDASSLVAPMEGVDYVFHAAALKQVPSCEFFPMEAVKTNVLGAENVFNAAIAARVKKVVALSTDKACYPINAMGQSKALMEKIMIAKSRVSEYTVFCATRYGNVLGSRGSVVPHFVDQIMSGKSLTVTNPNMTRFMMTIEQAVNLVTHTFESGRQGDIFVQKASASTIMDIAVALQSIFSCPNRDIVTIGTRHGEKLYETLVTAEEMAHADEGVLYIRIPADARDLNYGLYTHEGEVRPDLTAYTSHKTGRLTPTGTMLLLKDLECVNTARDMR